MSADVFSLVTRRLPPHGEPAGQELVRTWPYRCATCGQWVNARDPGEIFFHDDPDHTSRLSGDEVRERLAEWDRVVGPMTGDN